MTSEETLDLTRSSGEQRERNVPGLVVIFSDNKPLLCPIALPKEGLIVGRELFSRFGVKDPWASRNHAKVTFREGSFWAEDLESRNGTQVDGEQIDQNTPFERVLRVGQTLIIAVPNIGLFEHPRVRVEDGIVVGPRLDAVLRSIEETAATSRTLFINGESGTGKELLARRFHLNGPHAKGPFIPVNCATIPSAIAERLLFGAKKGVYSGAVDDTEGYFQSADGGTLFLDEIAELDASVQAKLLRAVELGEVQPLGAQKVKNVSVHLVSASHMSLADAVSQGKFRQDLYYRLGKPAVIVPPLRQRPEEIPWLTRSIVDSVAKEIAITPGFIENCLLRDWNGNIREFLVEIRQAARKVQSEKKTTLTSDILPEPLTSNRSDGEQSHSSRTTSTATATTTGELPIRGAMPDRETIDKALHKERGNVTRTAKILGLHRNQLRRWIAKNNVDLSVFQGPVKESEDKD